jgi:hypothetical protein
MPAAAISGGVLKGDESLEAAPPLPGAPFRIPANGMAADTPGVIEPAASALHSTLE